MPTSKPMKIQWITINGRQVPLVLPQTYSYADDDWKVTSDRDPLPIVEYGTTEGGVIVPKRVSDEGHELTQLTGSNIEVARGIYDQAISVESGSALSIKIEPPDDEVWKLIILRLTFPAISGATTGNHRLIASVGTVGNDGAFLDISNPYNKEMFIISNKVGADNINIDPNWVMQAIQETYVSKNAPLYLYYANSTNVDINNNIIIRVVRLVYKK